MLKAIIVDDEQSGREMIELLLRSHAHKITAAAICNDGPSAIMAIHQHHPDVVFLDVEMPGMNAFEMIKKLDEVSFDIIFITAHNHYAINAIELSAFAYLLKPVNPKKFDAAIEKLMQKKRSPDHEQLSLLLKQVTSGKPEKIAVPTLEGLLFIPISDIVRCEADRNYTHLFLSGNKKVLVSKTLKEFETLLESLGFIRIHHAHLINVKHIEKYVRGEGGYVIMTDQQSIDISRNRKEEFLKRILKV